MNTHHYWLITHRNYILICIFTIISFYIDITSGFSMLVLLLHALQSLVFPFYYHSIPHYSYSYSYIHLSQYYQRIAFTFTAILLTYSPRQYWSPLGSLAKFWSVLGAKTDQHRLLLVSSQNMAELLPGQTTASPE
jgi:hypothetical protein